MKKHGHKVLRWIGWGTVYLFAFYLGNVSGEYVAAKMPIFTFAMPRISFHLPSFMLWKRDKMSSIVTHTTLKFIDGEFLNVPQDGATPEEKQEFTQKIQGLAKKTDAIRISDACQIDPAFIKISKGASLTLTNTSASQHTIMLGSQEHVLEAKQTSTVTIPDPVGIYAVSCDSELSGFYSVEE